MVCYLFEAKSSPKSVLTYTQLLPTVHFREVWTKIKYFAFKEIFIKCRLQNKVHLDARKLIQGP